MKLAVFGKLGQMFGKTSYILKKRSPEIAMVVAGVGSVTAMVLTYKATMALPEVLEDAEDDLNKIKEKDNPEYLELNPDTDIKKETTVVYAKTAFKIARLYAPAIIMETVSLGSMVMGHKILKKRNIALAAYAATINNNFEEYRKRVIDRFGEEVDHQIKYNTKTEEAEETVVDDKGKERTKKSKIEVSDKYVTSPYMRYFTKKNANWEDGAGFNEMFFRGAETIMNTRLRTEGHVVLNEVYKYLGMSQTKFGMVVGWVADPNIENKIKLTTWETYLKNANGDFEKVVAVDFENLDGDIFNLAEFKGGE